MLLKLTTDCRGCRPPDAVCSRSEPGSTVNRCDDRCHPLSPRPSDMFGVLTHDDFNWVDTLCLRLGTLGLRTQVYADVIDNSLKFHRIDLRAEVRYEIFLARLTEGQPVERNRLLQGVGAASVFGERECWHISLNSGWVFS